MSGLATVGLTVGLASASPATAAAYTLPTYVRLQGYPAVYVLKDGYLHDIRNPQLFYALGGTWNQVAVVGNTQYGQPPWPMGNPVQLVRLAGTNPVYEFGNTLHWIPNEFTFRELGFQPRQVYVVRWLPEAVGAEASPSQPIYPPTPQPSPPAPVIPPAPTTVSAATWDLYQWADAPIWANLSVPLPNTEDWQGEPVPDGQGFVWSTPNTQDQVMVQLQPTPAGEMSAPPQAITTANSPGYYQASLWRGANGTDHARETVNLTAPVTIQGQEDQALTISITYQGSGQRPWSRIETILGDWSVATPGSITPIQQNPATWTYGRPDWLAPVPLNL